MCVFGHKVQRLQNLQRGNNVLIHLKGGISFDVICAMRVDPGHFFCLSLV